jgi:hypothetical protein
MQRVWIAVLSVWAMLAIVTVLAWTHRPAAATPQQASFRMRKWIGQKGWRRLHYASFAAFALSLGHALFVGTDLHGVGGPVLALLAAGPVLWLSFYRLLMPRSALRPAPRPTPHRRSVTGKTSVKPLQIRGSSGGFALPQV